MPVHKCAQMAAIMVCVLITQCSGGPGDGWFEQRWEPGTYLFDCHMPTTSSIASIAIQLSYVLAQQPPIYISQWSFV